MPDTVPNLPYAKTGALAYPRFESRESVLRLFRAEMGGAKILVLIQDYPKENS